MTLNELIETVAQKDIELMADGDQLRYRAPAGALDENLKDELRRHKSELLVALNSCIAAVYYDDDQERWFKTADGRFWHENKETGLRTELGPGNPPANEPLPPAFFEAFGSLLGHVIRRKFPQ